MPTADDIAAQKRQADEHKRQADALAAQQKEILRKQIGDLDKHIAATQGQRSRAASDLSKLG